MAVFFDAVGGGDLYYQPVLSMIGPMELVWPHTATGSQIGVLVGVSYTVNAASLSGLNRKAWYGGIEMSSLGALAWGGADDSRGWTELFGLTDAPPGKQRVRVSILGGMLAAGKGARANSLSYTGVDGFGTVTTASGTVGTGTTQSVSGNGAAATKIATVHGAVKGMGLKAYTKTQRYLSNTQMPLVLGDADGTGSSQEFVTTSAKAGNWSALAVVVTPADIIATATGVTATPTITSQGRRYPRPGTVRRAVFAAEPEN